MEIDVNYLQHLIDILEGKKTVGKDCKIAMIKQGKRLISIERDKLKRRALRFPEKEIDEKIDFQ